MSEVDIGELANYVESSGSSSSGSRSSGPSVDKPDPGVMDLVFYLLDNKSDANLVMPYGPDAEVPEVPEVPESVQDEFDLPDRVTTMNLADMFDIDMSNYDYFGNPPRGSSNGDAKDPIDDAWQEMDLTGNGDLINDLKTVINGHFCQEIQDRFAPDGSGATEDAPEVIIAVTIPPNSSKYVNDDLEGAKLAYQKRQYARMYIRDSKTAGPDALGYRSDVGEISEDQADKLTDALNNDE